MCPAVPVEVDFPRNGSAPRPETLDRSRGRPYPNQTRGRPLPPSSRRRKPREIKGRERYKVVSEVGSAPG